MSDAWVAPSGRAVERQSKVLSLNPSTVESVIFPTEKNSHSSNKINCSERDGAHLINKTVRVRKEKTSE